MASKYGFSKTNPDYWLLSSQAIWNDPGITEEDKIRAQEALIKEYYAEKRDKSARAKIKEGGHVGPMSKEAIDQEIFSIENTKPAFRTAKQKKRLAELKAKKNELD